MTIEGIHHITLVAKNAQRNVAFYRDVLGWKLVKKTVNFDVPDTYHLYYGDDQGRPGSLSTFFEWPHSPPGQWGIGATHHFAMGAQNRDTLLKWKRYLADKGCSIEGPYDRTYFHSIYFTDPDGVILEIATQGPGWTLDEAPDALGQKTLPPPKKLTRGHRDEAAIAAATWPEPVPQIASDMRLTRLHHITAIGSDIDRTTEFYTGLLGMRLVKKTLNFDNPESPHYYYGVGDGAPGTVITYFAYPPETMRRGEIGTGLTHHFALAVKDEQAQLEFRERIMAAGYQVTPVLDRKYFRSIYFNDPDGHIVEIATDGPGFAVDEPPESLGQALSLPEWLEPQRGEIERGLRPIT